MSKQPFKQTLYDIIFGTNTPAGRRFDIILISTIIASVILIMLDSVPEINSQYHSYIYAFEWLFTLLFLVEYIARLYCSPLKRSYIFSFYGILDLLSILPSFIGLFIPGAQHLTIVRLIRVLRVFRVLKLMRYVDESNTLMLAINRSRRKIFVFFMSVLIVTVIFGSLLFVIEGPQYGFTSIPKSIYWAIVTITTVGYGDISPQTPLGQALASLIMITGYAIIAVPTGIITAELNQEMQIKRSLSMCPNCNRGGHEHDADHCKYCGSTLNL